MSPPSPLPLPRRWPWLIAAVVVAACAFVAHVWLHQREHAAEHAQQQATLFAAELRDRVTQTRTFVARMSPHDADTVVVPVIRTMVKDGQHRIALLAKTVDDPRVDDLQEQMGAVGRLAVSDAPLAVKTLQLTTAANRLAATADGLAASQRTRAQAISREAVIGSGATLLLALLLVAAIVQRSHRLVVRASREHAEQMFELAARDPLTGLPNRRRLADDLDHLALRATPERPVQVLVCDLDGFKRLNDSLGHEAGDEQLIRFAARLSAAAGSDGTVYRLGGDEFCVLSRRGRDVQHAVRGAGEPADGDGPSLRASVGCALMPTEAATPRAAMRLADARMYAAKAAPRVSDAA